MMFQTVFCSFLCSNQQILDKMLKRVQLCTHILTLFGHFSSYVSKKLQNMSFQEYFCLSNSYYKLFWILGRKVTKKRLKMGAKLNSFLKFCPKTTDLNIIMIKKQSKTSQFTQNQVIIQYSNHSPKTKFPATQCSPPSPQNNLYSKKHIKPTIMKFTGSYGAS